eukprot:CAMPEP_0114546346 /NCGR_PEP_ID=MMETSP0114-20121206/3883_1 /TAXON_ID=31324 /ORGANISM="Goniomonas sp, Strain m" /LENGTH=307 /DNA_ID=CAMNT_0001730831 /DNA_START=172 /DNA_END=1095 /DNA_ORIENTATION=-
MAVLQCSILAVTGIIFVFWVDASHSLFGTFDSLAKFLLQSQILVISYFFVHLAMRYTKKELMFARVVRPGFLVLGLVLAAILVFGFVERTSSLKVDLVCGDPIWLLYDVFGVTVTGLFFIAGLFISRKLNRVVKTKPLRVQKKRQMWTLLVGNLMSCLLTLIFDATVWANASLCRHVIDDNLVPLVIFQRVIGQLPSVWVSIVVFWTWHRADARPQQQHLPPSGRSRVPSDTPLAAPLLCEPAMDGDADPRDPFAVAIARSGSGMLLKSLMGSGSLGQSASQQNLSSSSGVAMTPPTSLQPAVHNNV